MFGAVRRDVAAVPDAVYYPSSFPPSLTPSTASPPPLFPEIPRDDQLSGYLRVARRRIWRPGPNSLRDNPSGRPEVNRRRFDVARMRLARGSSEGRAKVGFAGYPPTIARLSESACCIEAHLSARLPIMPQWKRASSCPAGDRRNQLREYNDQVDRLDGSLCPTSRRCAGQCQKSHGGGARGLGRFVYARTQVIFDIFSRCAAPPTPAPAACRRAFT